MTIMRDKWEFVFQPMAEDVSKNEIFHIFRKICKDKFFFCYENS